MNITSLFEQVAFYGYSSANRANVYYSNRNYLRLELKPLMESLEAL